MTFAPWLQTPGFCTGVGQDVRIYDTKIALSFFVMESIYADTISGKKETHQLIVWNCLKTIDNLANSFI